ncbi:alkylation response protein AidB-like acyl-CoA dehydrogenase [Streptosporangium album]|uniref:Alkylation response protein AidB-like acyl-CoA dehydrogenase n=1 Tax=Streptosporangium album TaxID=47479 RepID=A0A7W7S5C3_9ACTN|nr:acyl-CoA dehydrogenase family protein [Streptosporangium album]MBB4944164.1 alkylation response protein AidB-like acyl-CoA dehydrogenase [Streptosporangium album]
MDFSVLDLSEDVRDFLREVEQFLDEHLTPAVIDEEWETGAGHNRSFHRALGAKGWIFPGWPVADGGAGLDPVRCRLLESELRRRHAPSITKGTTSLSIAAVRAYADDELRADIVPRVARGEVCICLGYTEPDAGSDLAGVRTKATRDGVRWIISGSKMFTTGAQNCQYSFLVARTDPDAPKHHGLTVFLVPLDSPGVEVRPIHTLGGERTNVVYYGDVRVSDHYRIGPVNGGWSVLSGPLSAEHGIGRDDDHGLAEINPAGVTYYETLERLLEHTLRWAASNQVIDDPVVRVRLAQVALDIEAARNTPSPMGRVLASELLIRDSADMIDLVGPEALITRGEDGALEDGIIEWAHRFAQGTAIYAGTTEIHRNIIAERILGLPRHARFRSG